MDEEELLLGEQKSWVYLGSRKKTWTLTYAVFIHIVLCVALLASATLHILAKEAYKELSIFADLRSLSRVVKDEHPKQGEIFSDFSGPPSNVSARAWTKLLQPFFFNISAAELMSAGRSPTESVRVKDGGYIASLAVYHELHCLNQFRNFLYMRTDPSLFAEQEIDYWHGHLDHCIEVLRLSVMCSADIGLYTFTWPDTEDLASPKAHSESPRKCIDWTQLEEWSLSRSISLTPTLLRPD